MIKNILGYILRLAVFIALAGTLYVKIATKIMDFFRNCAGFLYDSVPLFQSDGLLSMFISFIIIAIFVFIASVGPVYFFAKICGLFKKLDGLRKWRRILITLLMSIIFGYLVDALAHKKFFILQLISDAGFAGSLLFPAYLSYLFLNHLTKKHPVPFEKIGYYFSIEFFKDIIRRLTT